MALLPIILVILVAITLLFFVLKDLGMISIKQKIVGGIMLFILAITTGIYSYNKSQTDKQIFLLQMAFLRGETIMCKNQEVSAKNFNFVSGTLSLVGKKETPFYNLIFSLEDCKQQKNKENQNLIEEQLEKD